PAAAPDGTWFAYSTLDGKLMRQPIHGGAAQVIAQPVLGSSKISPDGRWIAATALRREPNGRQAVVLLELPVGGGAPVASLPWLAELVWDWTPSGDIAYVNPSARRILWTVSFGGGEPRKLLELPSSGLSAFAFSPDGKKLYASHLDITRDAVLLTD